MGSRWQPPHAWERILRWDEPWQRPPPSKRDFYIALTITAVTFVPGVAYCASLELLDLSRGLWRRTRAVGSSIWRDVVVGTDP